MSLDKIMKGLQEQPKKEESPFDRNAMGEYLQKRNSPFVYPPFSIQRNRKLKDDTEQQNTESNRENPEA